MYLPSAEVLTLIIAIFSGIVIPVFSLIIQQRRKKQKQITCELISNKKAIYIEQEIKNQTQILFDNRKVENAQLLSLVIKNTGKESINIGDYMQNTPIKLDFGNGVEILKAEIFETTPSSIKSGIIPPLINSSTITLSPFLLNSQESIILKVLATNFKNEIRDDTRFVAVKQIMKARLPSQPSIKNITLSLILIMAISSTLFIFIRSFSYDHIYSQFIPYRPCGLTFPGIFDPCNNLTDYYYYDYFRSFLTGPIISIIYLVVSYLIPLQIISKTHLITLVPSKKTFVLRSLTLSLTLFFITIILYITITEFMNWYLFAYIKLNISYIDSPTYEAFTNSGTFGAITTAIIIAPIGFFLNTYFPPQVPTPNS